MTDTNRRRVLNVGQCAFDHGNIARLLMERFDAACDAAATVDETVRALGEKAYDLVLINRILDADGASGLDLLRRLQTHDGTRDTPMILVSNYAEAQDEAVSLGAKPGFGKDALEHSETLDRLRIHLSD